MADAQSQVRPVDPVWDRICDEAQTAILKEPLIGALVHDGVLQHDGFERALGYRIAMKLASTEMSAQTISEIGRNAYSADPDIAQAARADLVATYDRDPACHRFILLMFGQLPN